MKVYLGDGVYAQWYKWGEIILTTEDGVSTTNSIVLEPSVVNALLEFIERSEEKQAE